MSLRKFLDTERKQQEQQKYEEWLDADAIFVYSLEDVYSALQTSTPLVSYVEMFSTDSEYH